tara:strand:- start:139761 stop:140303 length:543 start_codon:yes stop_codon:yes gene_type:complete
MSGRVGCGVGFQDGFEFLECSVVSCEEGPDGLVEDVADLLETQLAVVSELDDFSVGVVELFERGSKWDGAWLGVVRFCVVNSGVLEVAGVGGSCVSSSSAELVANSVHGDAEQPGLESALLVVAVFAEFGRYGDKHGLGQLLGKVVVVNPGSRHREDPAGIRIHESAPSGLFTRCGALNK